MVLTIVLYTCVLALVDLQAPGFFTGVFTCCLAFLAAVLQSSMASKISYRIQSFVVGTAARLRTA
jgi:hypothetical protein